MCESVIELRRTVDEEVDVAVVAELIASPGAEEIERARPKRAMYSSRARMRAMMSSRLTH
jgi:hypothetical protein